MSREGGQGGFVLLALTSQNNWKELAFVNKYEQELATPFAP
ncbi:hypothetical protein GPEL0_01r4164 [Geoanaerobacter pelophilus]|uniref:Uncharacterized protein n=1 Tax=Geoanaerobacter pelophilus TaxID=60036 RepID=A0ABQ0MM35_9BACT|nr:hypothetical protein GPEL0_01r4164 [Geoanaerobacter pelophilus]